MCHSERSAEDMQTARSKAKSLHEVELFSTELGRKKREYASGIFETVKASENRNKMLLIVKRASKNQNKRTTTTHKLFQFPKFKGEKQCLITT